MKRTTFAYVFIAAVLSLMSFTQTDFTKTLIGKWELQTIQSPGKQPMSSKAILGDMFLEFKSDFTYIESDGGSETKTGTWKITDDSYLQMKRDNQTAFNEKEKLKEISPDKIELTTSSKSKFVFTRIK
ncbi:MAG: lipocalin family protein [Cytophaga sp.]|uniref:lipocalin family protein n=1 Tax=Cytophaga sp. TaxID=29535 RepID=UPI003F7E6390